jgi:hypothetical protein
MSTVVDSMPSNEHEGFVDLVKRSPETTPMLLRDQLGMKLPSYEQVRLEPAELNDLAPTEYRADAVVTLRGADGDTPVLGVVIEVQLNRDGDKRWVWPVYLATLRARLRCPAMLLVVCPNNRAARWCAAPVDLGHPGLVLHPLVLGPEQMPVVTDVEQARDAPELAVLSAVARGGHRDHLMILNAVAAALAATDRDRAVQYTELLLAVLPEAPRRHWEALLTAQKFEFYSDYARRMGASFEAKGRAEGEARGEARGEAKGRAEGEARGKARGKAEAVLGILAARGIDVPDDARARIAACDDLDQLDIWVSGVATVTTVEDLFK